MEFGTEIGKAKGMTWELSLVDTAERCASRYVAYSTFTLELVASAQPIYLPVRYSKIQEAKDDPEAIYVNERSSTKRL